MKLALSITLSLTVACAAVAYAAPQGGEATPKFERIASVETTAIVAAPMGRVRVAQPRTFEIHGVDAMPVAGSACCGMPSDAVAY